MRSRDAEAAAIALVEVDEVFTTLHLERVAVWRVDHVQPVVVVGRDPGCDICIEDPAVSRVHAEMRRAGPGWVITDLMSRNGLSHAGVRFPTGRLTAGTAVALGGTLLCWWAAGRGEATQSMSPAVPFSPAQLRVLEAAAAITRGNPDERVADVAEIAAELVVSVNTVRTHLGVLAADLGVRGQSRGERINAILEAAVSRGWRPANRRLEN